VSGVQVSDNAAKKKDLTEALSVVAQARNSEALKRFLDTGEKPQSMCTVTALKRKG